MVNVDFEAMEEEYKYKIKELTSCSNYTANLLAKELLSLHGVSKCGELDTTPQKLLVKKVERVCEKCEGKGYYIEKGVRILKVCNVC
jgi:hypothetical protein